MQLPIYQVDAFARAAFRGNPAAIVPLEEWLPDATMQSIAEENNLSETAFYVPHAGRYHLRWFTPKVEIDLCGHATLATAVVILDIRREVDVSSVTFDTRSGELTVTRTVTSEGDRYTLDLPAFIPRPCDEPAGLYAALGAHPVSIARANSHLCVFETEDQIRGLAPEMLALAGAVAAVIVTAPGADCDFVSRFFAPAKGVPEDPVTGSAHAALIPYWSQRLGKKQMFARQISRRGGELWCEDRGSRVAVGGYAAKYLEGTITVP